MEKLYSDFLQIINSALSNTPAVLSDAYDFDKCVHIAKQHKITTLFYYGLLNNGTAPLDQAVQPLFHLTCQEIANSERQKYELSRITSAFDENGISYMLLKGAETKELYPKPEMRSMGDIDILIKVDQHPQIVPIMQSLGFVQGEESNHEYIWRKAGCLIELHKYLIPSYNVDFFSYFGDGWKLAKSITKTRFALSKEDTLIYLFTHFAKHYRDSGIGLRHIIDIWVYTSSNPDLDYDYVLLELKKLHLDKFYQNILRTLRCWFCNEPENDVAEFITEFIFNNCVYGTKHTHILAMALRDKRNNKGLFHIRTKKLYRSIFVSYKGMCKLYPLLKKWPVLLPFFWVYHLFRRIFGGKKLLSYGGEFALINHANISKYEEELNFVGLNYNFQK